MSKSNKPKRVLVEWMDICSPAQYWGDDSTWGTMKCFTVGYIARKTKTELAIAQTLCEDGSFGGVMSIPIGVIIKMVQLR